MPAYSGTGLLLMDVLLQSRSGKSHMDLSGTCTCTCTAALVFPLAFSPLVLAQQRIFQLTEDSAQTRRIAVSLVSPTDQPSARVCEPRAQWGRLGLSDLALCGHGMPMLPPSASSAAEEFVGACGTRASTPGSLVTQQFSAQVKPLKRKPRRGPSWPALASAPAVVEQDPVAAANKSLVGTVWPFNGANK